MLYMFSWPSGYGRKEVCLIDKNTNQIVKLFNQYSELNKNRKKALEWLKNQGYVHQIDPTCNPQELGGYRDIYIKK